MRSYPEAISLARDLIEPEEELYEHFNTEYARGVCEILADVYPVPGEGHAERKQQIARDVGLLLPI